MAVKFTNNAATTLAAGINSSATSISVTDGSVFPSLSSGEHFYCTFDDTTNVEIVKVTARSSNTLTVVRGQDNTTARAFSSGDKAELRVVAALLEDVKTEVTSTLSVDTFTGDDSTTAFTLSQAPASEDNLIVFIEGVYQNPGDFTLSGTTLTLDSAPVASRKIVAYHVSGAVSGNNLNHDQFTANGSTAAFTLSIAPIHENNTQVFIDGVYQQKDSYAVSGTTLTLDANPTNGAKVEVMTFTQTDVNTIPASFVAGLTEVSAVGADHLLVYDATDNALKKALASDLIETVGATPTFTTANITNTTTGDSLLFTTTEDSSTAAPVITLKRNSSSPADADYLGQLKFKGENDADQEVVYAKITSKIQDASDGSEDGLLEFANIKAGSQTITARLKSDKLQLLNSTGLEVAGESTLTGNVGIGVAPTHNFNLQATGAVEARFRSTDNDCYLQISSDTDEGQDSVLQFLAGTGAKGSITYDHNTTAADQNMIFKTGDNAVSALTLTGAGVVEATGLGFKGNAITSCSGFSGTAGHYYWIMPPGAMEPVYARYSGDNYKSRGKGYFCWFRNYSEIAPSPNTDKTEVNFLHFKFKFNEVMVEDESNNDGNGYYDSAKSYEWAYYSTAQTFDVTATSGLGNATSHSFTTGNNVRATFGRPGGHGLYDSTVNSTCSWGNISVHAAIGSGYSGSCGTFRDIGEIYNTSPLHVSYDISLIMGRPGAGGAASANFQRSPGPFSYWFNF